MLTRHRSLWCLNYCLLRGDVPCKPIQEFIKLNSILQMQLNASMHHQQEGLDIIRYPMAPRNDRWWSELGSIMWWGYYWLWSTAMQPLCSHPAGTTLGKMTLVYGACHLHLIKHQRVLMVFVLANLRGLSIILWSLGMLFFQKHTAD